MDGLVLIGEKINHSIPRIGRLLDARDFDAVQEVARAQEKSGADYIDVNVGPLPPEVMERVVKAVEGAVELPLCIDSTDPALLEAGIRAHNPDRNSPILNSAIEYNADRVFALRERYPCRVVLLVSERLYAGVLERNVMPEHAVETARRLFRRAREAGFDKEHIYVDPGTPPISSDMEGFVNTALESIERVRSDSEMGDVHILVGISNLTAGLPREVRLPLQNAFLTMAVARGLDTMIGDPAREYRRLEPGDVHLSWLERILGCTGPERLEELTSSPLYRGGPAADNMDKPDGQGERGDPE